MTPQTTFANGISPFPMPPPPPIKAVRKPAPVKPPKLPFVGEWDHIFAVLQPGEPIMCSKDEAKVIRASLRNWANRMGTKGVTRMTTTYPEPTPGRVWFKRDLA